MLVLKILLGVSILALVVWRLHVFNNHCEEKFDYQFLTLRAFLKALSSMLLCYFGIAWRLDALQSGGDPLNGIVVVSVGAAIGFWLIWLNFKSTNFLYGLLGSFIQLVVFTALVPVGIVVLAISFAEALSDASAERVHVINK